MAWMKSDFDPPSMNSWTCALSALLRRFSSTSSALATSASLSCACMAYKCHSKLCKVSQASSSRLFCRYMGVHNDAFLASHCMIADYFMSLARVIYVCSCSLSACSWPSSLCSLLFLELRGAFFCMSAAIQALYSSCDETKYSLTLVIVDFDQIARRDVNLWNVNAKGYFCPEGWTKASHFFQCMHKPA